MKRNTTTTTSKTDFLFLLVFVLILGTLPTYAQFAEAPPSAQLPKNQLPSDVYYDNNLIQLRGEWDEEPDPNGPGSGEEEGGNTWMGAPLGDGLVALSVAGASYLLFVLHRRGSKESKS